MGMIRFTARLTSEITKEVDWEVDADEFAEWSGNAKPTGADIRAFLQSGRDRDEIGDTMWKLGTLVDIPFVDIEIVTLLD